MFDYVVRERGIRRDKIVLFLDNASAHTSSYALSNLYHEDIKVIFNCPNTPSFNIIENVFADLKFQLRKKNLTKSEDLV